MGSEWKIALAAKLARNEPTSREPFHADAAETICGWCETTGLAGNAGAVVGERKYAAAVSRVMSNVELIPEKLTGSALNGIDQQSGVCSEELHLQPNDAGACCRQIPRRSATQLFPARKD